MKDIRVAQRYSTALYQAAAEQEIIDKIAADVSYLLELAETSDEFGELIHDPLISPEFKKEIFQNLFSSRVDPLMLGFLTMLADKQRERGLVAILDKFQSILDEQAERIEAQVTAATELGETQRTALIEKLSVYSGQTVRLKIDIDPSIQGGFIAKLGDTIFDGSITTQLERMKLQLARGPLPARG